jgi:hypothetical protein
MPNILHFTDVANLPGILDAGALRCHRDANTRADIGNAGIKLTRSRRRVDCGPGGTVGDYVPFYFAPRPPMMMTIMHGNVAGVSPDLSRLIYFVSSSEVVYEAGLPCVFSDGNAAVVITTFGDDRRALATHVDFPLMKQRMWANTPDDPDRRRRRMAEFLVHEQLPLEHVTEIVVRDRPARAAVDAVLQRTGRLIRTAVRSGWYF